MLLSACSQGMVTSQLSLSTPPVVGEMLFCHDTVWNSLVIVKVSSLFFFFAWEVSLVRILTIV